MNDSRPSYPDIPHPTAAREMTTEEAAQALSEAVAKYGAAVNDWGKATTIYIDARQRLNMAYEEMNERQSDLAAVRERQNV